MRTRLCDRQIFLPYCGAQHLVAAGNFVSISAKSMVESHATSIGAFSLPTENANGRGGRRLSGEPGA
jgi:hypothetical protein